MLTLSPIFAHEWDDCDGWEKDDDRGEKERYCEIRRLTLSVTSSVSVDAGRNGGVTITRQ